MTTYAEAFKQGRDAMGNGIECPYEFESENEQLHGAWWKGFDEKLAEVEADYANSQSPRRFVSTEAHLHYYESRD